MAGKRAKCPKCNMVFTLPAAKPIAVQASPPAVPSAPVDLFPKSNPDNPERRSSRPRDVRDDFASRRSRSRGRKSSALPWIFAGGGVAVVLFLLCAGSIAVVIYTRIERARDPGRFVNRPDPPPITAPPVGQPPAGQPPAGQPPAGQPPAGLPPGGLPPVRLPPVGAGGKAPAFQALAKQANLANGVFTANGRLTATDPPDPFQGGHTCHVYKVELNQSCSYVVDMEQADKGLDAFLRLADANGRELLFDDDSGGNFNARMTFMPATSGTYYVIATTFGSGGLGSYRLAIREYRGQGR
jgi:hypothetical protein